MELWTAFLLGLIGSLHCAGMCGPIALAIPAHANTTSRFVLGRLAYNLGRVATYCALGAMFGLVGKSFALIGWQRWVSLVAGVFILGALLIGSRISMSARMTRGITALKSVLGKLLRRPTLPATLFLGMLNGFLPCGLVYTACAGAVATGGLTAGISYMAVFGAGTIPMMLGIALLGKRLQFTLRFKLQKLVPATVVLLGVLLVLRGLALGIPYLSPDLATGSCCHR
jgi:sulfite exporter TauE/SafE